MTHPETGSPRRPRSRMRAPACPSNGPVLSRFSHRGRPSRLPRWRLAEAALQCIRRRRNRSQANDLRSASVAQSCQAGNRPYRRTRSSRRGAIARPTSSSRPSIASGAAWRVCRVRAASLRRRGSTAAYFRRVGIARGGDQLCPQPSEAAHLRPAEDADDSVRPRQDVFVRKPASHTRPERSIRWTVRTHASAHVDACGGSEAARRRRSLHSHAVVPQHLRDLSQRVR